MKKKIKFSLERYNQGNCEVITESGNQVRIFCTDFKGEDKFFIIGAVKHGIAKDNENLDYWDENGNSHFGNFGEFNLCLLVDAPYQFKPFDKVLARYDDEDKWQCDFFIQYDKDSECPYQCFNRNFCQCIPYVGNEELFSTTDAPKGDSNED